MTSHFKGVKDLTVFHSKQDKLKHNYNQIPKRKRVGIWIETGDALMCAWISLPVEQKDMFNYFQIFSRPGIGPLCFQDRPVSDR